MRRLILVVAILLSMNSLTLADFASEQVRNQRVTLKSTPSSISLSFKADDVVKEIDESQSVPRDAIGLPDEGFTYQNGKPMLPAVSRVVVVPPTAGLRLNFDPGEARVVRAEREPLIAEDPHDGHHGEAHEADNVNWVNGSLYPPVVAEMSEPYLIRGVRLVTVTTYPVQYDSETGEYIYRDDIQAEIEFTNDEPVNPSLHPIRRHRSPTFLKFIRGLAINGDEVGRDDPDRDIPPPYLGHYLVVLQTPLLRHSAPFIEWRRRQGYKMEILSLTNQQATSPSTVKNLIKARWDGYLEDGEDPFDYIMLIGDHEHYDDVGGAGENVIATNDGNSCWPHNQGNHFDYEYACLDGNNDQYGDVAISRWPAGNQDKVLLNLRKTLAYEMEPFMENTEWFNRAAAYGQRWSGSWHIGLHTAVRYGKAVLKGLGFTDVRHYEDPDRVEGQGEGVGPFITRQLNDGASVIIGRAENYHYRYGMQNVNRNTRFPIDMDVAGHHEWSCWHMLRDGGANDLRGPVAATTGWGNLTTLPNNIVWMEMVNGFLQKDLPYAWSRLQGVIAPTTYIPNFYQSYPCIPTDIVYYGDPAIQAWIGVPRVVRATYTAEVNPRTRRVDVNVTDNADGEPVSGADVTLYFPGDMPAFDHNDYAGYTRMKMWTAKSDADGNVSIIFGEEVEFVNRTKMFITVSGRDIKPYLNEVTIGTPTGVIDLASWSLTEVAGNGDEVLDPGESYDLLITAANRGNENDLDNVTAEISSGSPYIDLQPTQVGFGAVSAGAEVDADQSVSFSIRPDCPDALSRPLVAPTLNILFTSGDYSWTSGIRLETHAPHIEFRQVVGGFVIPDSAVSVNIEIANIGSVATRRLTATLHSLGMGVTVIGQNAEYAAIEPGSTGRIDGQRFLLSGNRVVVPGSKTKMMLTVADDAGFLDTTFFEVQVRTPRANAPQGPDKYGYICFDDTDEAWDMAPDYDWFEIDPRAQNPALEGTQINFNAQVEIGQAIVADLPFESQFYGVVFDQITVCSNGYVCIGDQAGIANFQNLPLDRAISGGVGMMAPFWDKLALGQNGRVYYAYDEENARFIVEWSRVKQFGGNDELIFQVIILDRSVWITETGDPNVLFQYKQISDTQAGDQTFDTPYASIGISSPRGDTGLSYRWRREGPVTSAPLENRRALLFSTSPRFRAGVLQGYVTDAANGSPVENAVVFTEHGFLAYTDSDGFWRIIGALAEVDFNITCRKIGFNDSSYTALTVPENDTLVINFDLLHPEFTISAEDLGANLRQAEQINIPFHLDNTGNGPLRWSAEKRLLGDANALPWQLRRTIPAGDSVQDDRCEGVVFANERFFVSGANGADPSQIYVLDRAGQLVRQFEQAGSARYGFKDLEWDGQLLWGSGDTTVFGFTTEGELVSQWRAPLNPCNNIAYDSDRDILWIAGTTTHIFGCTRDGEIVDTLNRKGFRMYGLAYWPEDPDGKDLYIVHVPGQEQPNQVYKMNTETGDTAWVRDLVAPEGATGIGGCWITNTYDVYSWVLMTMPNVSPGSGGDRIEIYQLDARKDWMNLDVWGGLLQTGEGQDFTLTLDATGLPDTLFEGEMRFTHNADDNVMQLMVSLNIFGERPPVDFGLLEPADGDTVTALPLHGGDIELPGIDFVWEASRDPNDLDTVLYRMHFSVGDRSVETSLIAGTSLRIHPDTLGLALTFDEPLIWWVTAESGDALTQSAARRLVIIPDDVDADKFRQPYEFGLAGIWPNPFNARATVRFTLDRESSTSLKLYDMTGRVAAVLFEGRAEAGVHKVALEGESLASGVYLLRLESAGRVKLEKVALVR